MRQGFTLIETLIAAAVVGIGIVGSISAIGSMTRTERRVRESALVRHLAIEKLDELIATGDLQYAPLDGDFTDRNLADWKWSVETEPADVENILIVRVRVTTPEDDEGEGYQLTTVRYEPPVATGAEN